MIKKLIRIFNIAVIILGASVLLAYAQPTVGAILEHQSFFFAPPDEPEFTASLDLEKKLTEQTVSITMISNGVGSCSGTIIHEVGDKQYVLTAKHCVDVTEEMYVEHIGVLYAITSVSDDLAILVTEGKIPGKKVAVLSEWEAFIGEDVHHVAYPSGVIYKASGKVSRNSKDHQYLDFKAIGGCSGGGVFNDDGELVSVLWGGYMNPKPNKPLKSVAEPLKDVRLFLDQVGISI